MLVKTEQLTPGCVVITDVMGKTKFPLIHEKTVLTDQHITFLKKFLVESVHVSEKLDNGEMFKQNTEQKETIKQEDSVKKLPLKKHFIYVVKQYKSMFTKWQNQVPVDMAAIRNLIVPLLERTSKQDAFIFIELFKADQENLYSAAVSLSVLSAYTGILMGYEQGKWLQLGFAGLLADSGLSQMVGNPNEATAFDAKMKNHPAIGYRMVEKQSTLTLQAKIAILQHHEKLDGSGYPLKLAGNKIDPYARIVSFCDHYYVQVFKHKRSPFEVLDEMMTKYVSWFDQRVVQKFAKQFISFVRNKEVILSNGKVGKVVFIEIDALTTPLIEELESGKIETMDGTIKIKEIKES